ncbi:MAG: C40 family peptidase [Oscillospiraceae bacterium]|nr:C40 family peptidase [Oscillospiraceae bacterium]
MKKTFKVKAVCLLAFAMLAAIFSSGCVKTGNPTIGEEDEPYVSVSENGTEDVKPNETTEPVNSSPIPSSTPPQSADGYEITDVGTPTEEDVSVSPIEENQIVSLARTLIGVEFVDGGDSPSEGFDNSGFIYYVLKSNGYVNCPRGINEQASMGDRIDSISDLKSGDLVFFSDSGEMVQFGGIYIGDGIMVSCRMPGELVREFDITSSYYSNSFFTGVRVL